MGIKSRLSLRSKGLELSSCSERRASTIEYIIRAGSLEDLW
jgi:hypothetical protein